MVARFLGTIAFVLVLFGSMLVWPASVSADDAQNINTYRGYIDAINRGDAAAALAAFADDAQLSGIPPGCLTPCNGGAAIQAQLNLEVNLHLQLQLLSSIQVSNGVVTAQVAHRADSLRQAGISRVLTRDTVTFKGDKISKFVIEFDTTDQQTAARVALLSAPAPTAVAPAAVAAAPVISSPSTGDAGLLAPAQASRLRSLFVPAAVLGAALTLGGLSVRLRRRTA